ncbi:hypothetical protein [Limosilactobacillus vaginalis]|jgi:putative DNA primase/helicase|uniref:phage NrS-1 polymerase family protein n=2 Tax=Limosilactobacillus TaxID=2742598 RepID=UPI0022A97C50|nr:hypothetical protein [Limosilactobacillus vaginalis]MCZ2465271.1 hypothetical protein [Limosilactobacillus vaginalis]
MDFPEEMKKDRRWVAWFYEKNPKHPNSIHALKKVPYNLNDNCHSTAQTNQPATWGTFQQANATLQCANKRPDYAKQRQYGGVGFVVGDGWALLDLDNIPTVIADYTLGVQNKISKILQLLHHTYCEISQSEAGLHFVFKVDDSVEKFSKPEHDKELYTNARLIALTGKILEREAPLKITTINQDTWKQLNELVYGRYEPLTIPSQSVTPVELSQGGELSDTAKAIIQDIKNSSDGDRFNWWCNAELPDISGSEVADENGELIQYDPSRQDMACCCVLAYWVRQCTGKYDSKLIDEIFKQTNLYRPKWERSDGGMTYGQRTISKAIAYKQAQREDRIHKYKGMVINGAE